jgi:8-oxo-dGTP diphosphatase
MGETIRVCCAILVDKNLVLCAQRSSSMSLPDKWEFPGGKIEPGEQTHEALRREIREELGVEIEVLQEFKSTFHRYSEERHIELIPFLARIIKGSPNPTEHQTLKWVKLGDLKGLDWAEADIPIVNEFIKWKKRLEKD